MRTLSIFVIFFSLSTLLLTSCKTPESTTQETPEASVEPVAVDQRTITGSFRSVEGVMNNLSCYCSFGGYVTTADGAEIAVCFDESVQSCDKITVTGYRTSKKIEDNGANGACPAGIMGFIKVQSYIIGETDY